MSIFARALAAKKPKTKESQRFAWGYAVVLAIMAVAQLVSFSKFVLVIDSYWLPGGLQTAATVAGCVIAIELLAIAFLLRLKLSPAFRVFSMMLGWIVPFVWLVLSLMAVMGHAALSNVGFLGGLVSLTPGWWAIFYSLALVIVAVWVSWGLWPFPLTSPKRKK